MRDNARPGLLVGRSREMDRLLALIAAAREGRSGSVVVRAAAGMGKTALLTAVQDACGADVHVVWVSGAEAEMVLDFAGLQRLYAQLGTSMESLPAHQQRALRTAICAGAGDPPDPFLVGLAVVNLISDAGAEHPLVCFVDDAQWLDEASRQALGFVARRVLADRVAMIFATRDAHGDYLDGIDEIRLAPLGEVESGALLDVVLPGRLDRRVRERLLADAGGNPLALHELPATLSPAELAGGYGLTRAGRRSSADGLEEVFAGRYGALPEPTRLLLLTAAAEPVGDPVWLWAAAGRLGLDVADADPAEAAGLIKVDTRITFHHPLVRTAILRTAPSAHRHRVHAALAETIDRPDAADYRAWHRAHATSAPSERVAAELVDAAHRARDRGGIAAAAAFFAYAVELTPDYAVRAGRALQAAAAKLDAGDVEAAERLITIADTVDDDRHRARLALLRARLAFAGDRGRDGPQLLLTAAQALAESDPIASRETYLEALMAAMIVGRLAIDVDHGPHTIARAACQAPPAPIPPRAVDLLLDGLVVRLTQGYEAAAGMLSTALHAYLRDVRDATADPRWHDITNRICLDLLDFDAYRTLAVHQLDMLRAAGELTVLPAALATMASVEILDGRFDDGEALLDEALIVSSATGSPPHRSGVALLAAHRGDESRCLSAIGVAVDDAGKRGEGTEVTVALLARAMLNNGLARYAEALDACRSGRVFDDVGLYGCLLLETAEAAAGARDTEAAAQVAEELEHRARASRTESAFGLAARAAALSKGDRATDADYRRALTHLERSPLAVYRARTQLVYGEWLRRQGRLEEARTQLRSARDAFAAMGAEAFLQRAVRELQAAGGSAGARNRRYDSGLTSQERHISRLVRQGQTNAEIGAHLLISHRTVEWHLRNIYNKLGITSRRELRRLGEHE